MWNRNILNTRVLGIGFALVGLLGVAAVPSAQDKKPSPGGDSLIVRIALAKQLPRGVTRTPQLDAIVSQLRSGKNAAALAGWKSFVQSNPSPGGKKLDVNNMILWVLRKSYVEPNKDLKAAADRVQYSDSMNRALRREISSARRDLANVKSWPFTRRMIKFRAGYAAGLSAVESSETKGITETELGAYLQDLTNQLNTAAEDRQAQTIWLNQVLNDQQQIDTAANGVDTARDVIKNAYKVLEDHYNNMQQAAAQLLKA